MISRKAYAKINLCLDVLRRRADGYHEVRMVMQTVDIYDVLTFEINSSFDIDRDGEDAQIQLVIKNADGEQSNNSDSPDLGPVKKNLIYRAAQLVLSEYGIRTGVIISLEKHIPVAAGMAGGSTDAAAVFHGLNELLNIGMDEKRMCDLGVRIGADVPYCIIGGTALAEGIGEVLSPLSNPPKCYLLIAKPEISVSTKYVYEHLQLGDSAVHPNVDGTLSALLNQDLAELANNLGNILESVTTVTHPVINEIKLLMNEGGALNSLMSGSGPTVFGIFEYSEAGHALASDVAAELNRLNLAKDIFVTEFR